VGDTESVEIFRPPLTPRRKRDSAPKSNFLSVMRTMLLVVILGAVWITVVSGQTNLITLSDLDTAKSDWPKSVTATTNISITVQSGVVAITNGEQLSVLSFNQGRIAVLRGGMTNEIAAGVTDVVDKINTVRSHRLIVGKEQYDNYRLQVRNPTEVKISHSAGVATVPMAKLPLELQKQLGYDPAKAAEWQATNQKTQAVQKKKQEEQEALNKKLSGAIARWGTIEQILPQGIIVGQHSSGRTQRSANLSGYGIKSRSLIHIAPTDHYFLLVGHPDQSKLADGSSLNCYAYQEGVVTIEDQTLEKWIYCQPPPQKK